MTISPPPTDEREAALEVARRIDKTGLAYNGDVFVLARALLAAPPPPQSGWRLVPIEPTDAMVSAGGTALKQYLDALPDAERAKLKPRKTRQSDNAGYRVAPKMKCRVRWLAMLAAAPLPPKEANNDR